MCCLITCTCLHKTILCGDYGSGANHPEWSFTVLQFPFISQSSPRATFSLMSTPIQHKINWFHSRWLEMVGNIIPPYSWQQCVYACVSLNQQKIRRRKKKIFVFFNEVEAPSASWPDTDFKYHTDTSLWPCSCGAWGTSSEGYLGEGLGLLSWQLLCAFNCRKEQAHSESHEPCDKGGWFQESWSFCFLASSCRAICLFWELPSPTVCSWVSSTPGSVMTETKIFPPVANGTPLLKQSQKPHPRLPPLHPLVSVNKMEGFIAPLMNDHLRFKAMWIQIENDIFIFKCKVFGRSHLLEHVTIHVARRGDHYPEKEPDCCVWILKKTFGGGEHLQMLVKMGLELLVWSGNRWTIKCLMHDAACSKPTFWDPVILLL